jgi:hypothetical protein
LKTESRPRIDFDTNGTRPVIPDCISIPVIEAWVAIQVVSPHVTLLLFGTCVGLGLLCVSPVLIRSGERRTPVAVNAGGSSRGRP